MKLRVICSHLQSYDSCINFSHTIDMRSKQIQRLSIDAVQYTDQELVVATVRRIFSN